MSRRSRLSIAATPELREALEAARLRLMLPTEAAAAHWLLTWALAQLTREEAPQIAAHGRGPWMPDGGQVAATGPPNGGQADAERMPRGDSGGELSSAGEGEELEEGAGAAGGRMAANGLPLDGDQLDREVAECAALLQGIPGWPAGPVKDRGLLRELIGEFPAVDPLEVVKRLRTGALDQPLKPSGARNRLRTYFTKAEGMGQVRESRQGSVTREPVPTEYDAPPGLEE